MRKKQVIASCLLTGTLLLSANIFATDLGEGLTNEADSVLLKNRNNHYAHWNGIGKIFWDNTPACTASLLDTRDKNNKATGPAYLLTAAHCIRGTAGPLSETPVKETIKFNYYNDTSDTYKSYTIKKIAWKDYNHTDLAIMELDVALSTLLEEGITPLRLASEWAENATDVLVIGAPERLPESGLRMAACTQEPTAATLVEGFNVFHGTLKNRCKEIRPGSSGSPVIDRKSGHILGILTTSTYGATIEEKCFLNAPCEVRNGQAAWSVDTHYSHPIDKLSNCFSEGLFSDISNTCTAQNAFQVTDVKYWPTQYVAMPKDASSPDPVVNAQFSISTPYYRYKSVRDAIECHSPRHYSGTVDATDAIIDTPISRNPGMHYLCVVGVDSSEQRPDAAMMNDAWITPVQLIERNPVAMPEPTITLNADWNYKVKWRYLVPTHFGTLYYASPEKDTDCSNVNINDYIKTFEAVFFKAEQLPLTLCSRNKDLSNRYSKVRTDLLALP
ncbi:trypsin-like serine peptidase [Pseudomonas baetica]|uniref:trypsin-like serine peptidase n=1 Tax=Pseudomonas baetica TaxID=674054 RepID=UPI003EECE9B1